MSTPKNAIRSQNASITLKPMSPSKSNPSDSALTKEVLLRQLEAIEQNEKAEAERLKAEELAEIEEKKSEYENLIKEAEHFEKLSVEATQAYDKKFYAKESLDIRRKIEAQYPEFIQAPPPTAIIDNPPTFSDKRSAIIQLASVAGLLAVFFTIFQIIRNYILAYNSAVLSSTAENNTATLMSSYGPDSFQKLAFEGIATCIDLFTMLGILFLISPTIFKYIVPFFNSKHSPQQDFNSLTAWERQLKSFLLLASLLLYLGLRHAVKP